MNPKDIWTIDLVLAVFFFGKLGCAYFDYRRSGHFEWTVPAILFACLVFMLTAPLYIWTILAEDFKMSAIFTIILELAIVAYIVFSVFKPKDPKDSDRNYIKNNDDEEFWNKYIMLCAINEEA